MKLTLRKTLVSVVLMLAMASVLVLATGRPAGTNWSHLTPGWFGPSATVQHDGTETFAGTTNFTGAFKLSGTTVTATAAQLNSLAGMTSGTSLSAGSSGVAGTITVFPTTASSGKTTITATDNTGDTTTAIVTAAQAGARTYTIPDAGVSTSFVFMPGTGYVQTGVECLLKSTTTIDVGSATAQTIYTVPTGVSAVITKIVFRNASGTFDQAQDPIFSIGWNSTAFNNVVASATYTNPMAAATNYFILVPDGKSNSTVATAGAAAGTLKVNVTQAATASTTCTVSVFGYLY